MNKFHSLLQVKLEINSFFLKTVFYWCFEKCYMQIFKGIVAAERGAMELPSQVFDSPESVFLTTTHSEFPLWRKQRVAVLEEEAGDSITIPLGNSPS